MRPEDDQTFAWHRPTLRAVLPGVVSQLGPLLLVVLALALGRGRGFSGADVAPLVGLGVLALAMIWGWLFTRWRVTDEVVEVRRGFLARRHLTIARDRVRSVDTKAGLLARLVRVVDVKIGTGVEGEGLELKGLDARDVGALRAELGRTPRRAAARTVAGAEGARATGSYELPVARPEQVLARFDPAWLRLAPFTVSGFVGIVVLYGLIWQVLEGLDLISDAFLDRHLPADLTQALLWGGVALLVLLVLAGVLSFITYAIAWWDLRLVRRDGRLNLAFGLLSTRTITVEERRVLGTRMAEPVLLALVQGARLQALATGSSERSVTLLPAVPRAVAAQVAADVLGGSTPLEIPLTPPVRAAVARRFSRAQWGTYLVLAVLAALTWWLDWPWWVPALAVVMVPFGVVLGRLRARHLGHALTPTHLIIGRSRAARERVVLRRDGIIGWTLRQTVFQRRSGLVTLVATTSVGERAYSVLDLPMGDALELARHAQPVPGEALAGRAPH